MMKRLNVAVAAAVALGCVALSGGTAAAMPRSGLDAAVAGPADAQGKIQDVGWVCGPFRCFWRPNYFYGGYYGPRPYWGPRFFYGGYGPRWHYWHRW